MHLKRRIRLFIILVFGLIQVSIFSETSGICSEKPDTSTIERESFFGIVNVSRANIRNRPSTESKIIGNIANRGTIVRILGCEADWCKIIFESKEGWILRQFITNCDGKGVVNATGVNVRSGPSLKYKIIQQIPHKGTIVEIIESTDSWYKIQSRNSAGWMYKKYITSCESETKVPQKEMDKIKTGEPSIKSTGPPRRSEDIQKAEIVVTDKPKTVEPSKDIDSLENQKKEGVIKQSSTKTALVQTQAEKRIDIKLGVGYSYINETIPTTYQGSSIKFMIDRSFYPVLRFSYYIKEDLAIETGLNYDPYKWELTRSLSGKSSSVHGFTFVIGPKQYWENHLIPYFKDSRFFAQFGIGYKILDITLDSYVEDYDSALGGQISIGIERKKFDFRIGYNYFKHDVGNVSNNFVVNSSNDELDLSGLFFDITYSFFGY